MSMWQSLKCRVGLHDYGPVEGDEIGAHETCRSCGHVQRAIQPPPDSHDHRPPR